MRTLTISLTIVASLCLNTAAWGQRALQRTEIQGIFQQVTSQPRQTWIPAGTIVATHQEYGAPKTTNSTTINSEIQKAISEYQNDTNKKEKTVALQKMKLDAIPFNVRHELANEYSMSSRVTVRYDNGRFYWEIDADSRQDSIKPDASLAGNYMTRHFDMNWNKRRIFAWDGQKYTTYTASGNQATVDAAGKMPRAVNGPLTAGLIPWGNGRFTLANLTAAQSSASETSVNGKSQIDMTLAFTDGSSANLTLDSSTAYAVTKATLTWADKSVVIYTCSGYKQYGNYWVPSTVTVERRNTNVKNKLATSEQWTFTSVSSATPAPGSFNVPLAVNAKVEYASPVTASPSMYVQSYTVDTDELLAQRLAYEIARDSRPQNCATAALQRVASELGKPLSAGALARLVGPNGRTSLYDMKRFAESQGLYCRAVKTDLATLKNLNGVKAILHIPGKNHFVVLDAADDRDVWLIDLSSRKFYYRKNADFFPMEWSEGTALLLSDRPISSQFPELPDAALAGIVGSSGWSCTMLLQEYAVGFCDPHFGGCSGSVTIYYERWGCDEAPTGTCDEQVMVRCQDSMCDFDGYCTITGDWFYYYMWACA